MPAMLLLVCAAGFGQPPAEFPGVVVGQPLNILYQPPPEQAGKKNASPEQPPPEEKKPADELNVDAVFAKLKQLGGKSE